MEKNMKRTSAELFIFNIYEFLSWLDIHSVKSRNQSASMRNQLGRHSPGVYALLISAFFTGHKMKFSLPQHPIKRK
jgi:hypothetical protein